LNAKLSAIDAEVVVRGNAVVLAVLESTVLDQLSIDATITRVVDILRKGQHKAFEHG
jgi:hypothetical protein